jgi:F420-dependent oxidoreductase-like protein
MPASARRPLRFGVQLQPQRTTWSDFIGAVRAVEALGFDTLWNFDHMLPFSGAPDGPCFETWTTLAAMATQTSRIRIGALVNGVIYRDPATLAKSATMVDIMSNGRLEFTLGAAWAEREFRAYGLPFPPLAERLARLDEALAIVRALWTQPRTTYEGRYYAVHDAPLEPKPVQQPHPPIMVGGSGRGTLQVAAKYADAWNCMGSPEYCAGRIALLREYCAAIARDANTIELSVHPQLAIGRSHDEAEANAWAIAQSHGQNLDEERDKWLLGTPAEIRVQVQRYVDVGITHWIMAMGAPFDLEALQLFADEVVAAFR